MDKRDDSSSDFLFRLAQGAARFNQSEGGSPGASETSLIYELGVNEFAQSVADLLYYPNSTKRSSSR